jgi:hypothetical protein
MLSDSIIAQTTSETGVTPMAGLILFGLGAALGASGRRGPLEPG